MFNELFFFVFACVAFVALVGRSTSSDTDTQRFVVEGACGGVSKKFCVFWGVGALAEGN
jgi:hypothetical protein